MRKQGFTIIEVTLFIAISGLLFFGLFVAIGNRLNNERYNDSVQTALDYIQGEYTRALVIENTREEKYRCISNTGVTPPVVEPYALGVSRGTSTCSVIGRIVRTNADANKIASYPLFATADITEPGLRGQLIDSSKTEIEKLDLVRLATLASSADVDSGKELKKLPWGTYFSGSGRNNTTPKPFSMIILRMPYTDTVSMYVNANENATITDIYKTSLAKNEQLLCVEPNGLIQARSDGSGSVYKRGVYIPRNAASVSAIVDASVDGKRCM